MDILNEIWNAIVWFFTSQDIFAILARIVSLAGIFSKPFWLIGLFFTRKFKPAQKQHRYAILIPAKNESAVIGNLLDSIAKQDYPAELLKVFVVADNCSDNTAAVAREKGAICYERFNDRDKTKGYALQFLIENIRRDFGIETFDGYFIFDADNLLNVDYVTRMNESFDAGLKIVTSYRNTKNFDENWMASTYALHWIRSVRKNHRARSVLRLSTNIQGTGFLFSNIFVKDGWNYTSLTEDRAFTADAVARGYEISYNDAAMFYDEQPTSLRVAWRQRLRWSKGHLQAFAEKGGQLFLNVLLGSRFADKELRKPTFWGRVVESVRHRVASLDTLCQLFPQNVANTAIWLVGTLICGAIAAYSKGFSGTILTFASGNYVTKALSLIFGTVTVKAPSGWEAVLVCIGTLIVLRLLQRAWGYVRKIPMAAYIFVVEHKNIIKMPLYKKILYCFTWPVYDSLGRYTSYVALFRKVSWWKTPHSSQVTIEDIKK